MTMTPKTINTKMTTTTITIGLFITSPEKSNLRIQQRPQCGAIHCQSPSWLPPSHTRPPTPGSKPGDPCCDGFHPSPSPALVRYGLSLSLRRTRPCSFVTSVSHRFCGERSDFRCGARTALRGAVRRRRCRNGLPTRTARSRASDSSVA